jgi:ABC-type lipoprotein release transport system permease subunit
MTSAILLAIQAVSWLVIEVILVMLANTMALRKGLLAALLPAWRATRISIAAAMRKVG